MEAEALGIERRAAALSQNQEAVIAQQIAENLPEVVRAAASSFDHVEQLHGAQRGAGRHRGPRGDHPAGRRPVRHGARRAVAARAGRLDQHRFAERLGRSRPARGQRRDAAARVGRLVRCPPQGPRRGEPPRAARRRDQASQLSSPAPEDPVPDPSVGIPAASSRGSASSSAAFVEDVAGPVDRPAAIRQRLVDLAHLGAPEVLATSQVTGRIAGRAAERRATSAALAGGLRELHGIVEDLDPGDPDRFDAYLERYARSRDRLDAAVADLADDLDALGIEIAARGQDEQSLELEVASLRRYAVMAGRLDEALDARLDDLSATDPSRARRLRDEVLAPVRSRRRDLLLHLEVATQSLLGLRALAAHDETLREAVSLVRATTVAALDAAALVAQMLAERRRREELGDAVEELRRSWRAASEAIELVDRAVS